MSAGEAKLWSALKRMRSQGFHFRRQKPFRGYYLDFVCINRRLIIEVDGSQHTEDAQIARDLVRDRVAWRQGFEVMRLDHSHILHDFDSVALAIDSALRSRPEFRPRPGPTRLAASAPIHPPHKGEG